MAVVEGNFPEGEIVCDFPLRESPDDPLRLRMHRMDGGKECRTVFRKQKQVERDGKVFSVVEAELVTGRKHQIRAHLAELGFPIVGDRLYSHDGMYYEKMARGGGLTEEDFAVLGAHSQMLYAYKAEIQLPYWKSPRTFTSTDYPEEMKSLMDSAS